MNDTSRIDPHEVAVIRQMMNRAEGDAVDDGGGAARIVVFENVGRLEQLCLSQCAHGALPGVGLEHQRAEPMLVEPHDRLARRVAAQIRIGGETGRRGVSERQCRLEFDEAFFRIVVNHEGRCHSRADRVRSRGSR